MIAIGCDHGALDLKNQLIDHLKKRGIECKDTGCYTNESCDYPVYAKKVTDLVNSKECELGILLCGTGIGMSIAANKVKQHFVVIVLVLRQLDSTMMQMYFVLEQELLDQNLHLELLIHL